VVPDREAKSISNETTFETDIYDMEILRSWLPELTEQVARRLRRHGLQGRTVQVKIRFPDFRTITRSQTLAEPTSITQEIWRAADELLSKRVPENHPPVRLLGIGVSGLEIADQHQPLLFGEEERERQRRLDDARDHVKERFGSWVIGRAESLRRDERRDPDRGE